MTYLLRGLYDLFYAQVFTEHANKLVEVANLACTMSNNEDGVKMVRYGAAQIEQLCPQVINAASILSARPKSKVSMCSIVDLAPFIQLGLKISHW